MYEFERMLEAYDDQFEARSRREAQWVAHIMNAAGHYDPPITVKTLLGETEEEKQQKADEIDELRQRAERRKEERLKQRGSSG